jgi:hypothetical protein
VVAINNILSAIFCISDNSSGGKSGSMERYSSKLIFFTHGKLPHKKANIVEIDK